MQPTLFQNASVTVTDITRYLRQWMESDEMLRDIWVVGEISNLSRPASGHVYFTLKDDQSALRCVIWRTAMMRIRVSMQNGSAIEAHGYISIYERDGAYQLYVDTVRLAGEGVLYQEFLRLKARLEAEGLFDEARKRSIPLRPERIGIVTSPTGAALQDMLNTLKRRYPLAEVIISPTSVQGDEAPAQITAAIDLLNRKALPDVILVARGGGSLEDLWAFNDERVVRTIAASKAPVITGIGHETDFTLSDFAADLRAPTPTAAAVLATPDAADIRSGLQAAVLRLNSVYQSALISLHSALAHAQFRIEHGSPLRKIQEDRQQLDDLASRSWRTVQQNLSLRRARWQGFQAQLLAMDPRAVLKRGYAILQTGDVKIISSVDQAFIGQEFKAIISDGSITALVSKKEKET